MESPESPKNEKRKRIHKRKISKSKHLVPKLSNSNNSFTLPPMGDFFKEEKGLEKVKKSNKSNELEQM
jgi:hypothetical protein